MKKKKKIGIIINPFTKISFYTFSYYLVENI